MRSGQSTKYHSYTMKMQIALLLSFTALVSVAGAAQTAAPAKHPTAARPVATDHGCAKLPPISPKIPALPAGTACARPIYTLSTVPPVNLSDVSPALAPSIREYLGIESTTFSLSYIDTRVGTGELAAPHKWYSVQYTGYLADGTVFDASSNHPNSAPFVLQQGAHMVIPGWDTGFYGMRVGGKRRLFIPHQLAYGSRANGPVPANADLIFDIELVSESDSNPTPPAAAAPAKPPTPAPGPAATAPATPPPAAVPPKP